LILKLYNYVKKLKSSPELRKSVIYVLSSGLAFGLVFIQNFSIAYFSSITFFGGITLLISLFSTLYVIFTCGLNAVVLRYFFDKKYAENQKEFISHLISIWLIFGGIFVILFLFIGYFIIEEKHLLSLNYHREFIPIVFGAFLYSFVEIFPNIFIAQDKPIKYGLWLISGRLTIFLLLHASIFIFGESTSHVAMVLLLSGFILSSVGFFIFRVFPLSSIDKAQIKEIFIYAFPLMIYGLGGIGYSHGYRVIISTLLSYKELAIFTLTSQIALVFYLTASSCVTGFYPKAYKALEAQQGDPRAIAFYIKLLLVIGLGLVAIIFPCSYIFLMYFKGGIFFEGIRILPFLLIGQFFFFLYAYNYILCTFYKETKILTYSMAVGIMVSLSLTFLLLRNGNLWGAAVSVSSGLFTQFLTSFFLIRRVIRNTGYGS
jgi:O-antigen/teichoic acid export membrane protein